MLGSKHKLGCGHGSIFIHGALYRKDMIEEENRRGWSNFVTDNYIPVLCSPP